MEQLVILLIIGAISLINWLLQKSAEHKQRRGQQSRGKPTGDSGELTPWLRPEPVEETTLRTPEPSGRPVPSPSAPKPENEAEEQLRRFFEALGLPPPNEPQKEPEISLPFEPAPPTPPPLPPEASVPAPPPRSVASATPRPSLRESREMRELAEQFERHAREEQSDTSSSAPFRELLRSPNAVRQAIILREILGPPKALEN